MAGCRMQSHSGRSIGNVDLLFTDFNLSFADYKKNQCLQEADDVAGILWDILVTPFTFYKDYFDSVFVATVSGDYNLITDAITR